MHPSAEPPRGAAVRGDSAWCYHFTYGAFIVLKCDCRQASKTLKTVWYCSF